ncbi:hypothetical protein EJA00_10745 [Streptococcus suis]|uniref:Uncharacterized protein n=1 Tax=Streptococcus suis TaxID=1307 RepID=A0A426T1V1_STRSU|nr:hypothetical protein EJA00_10745 [Streptococcus suis]
MTKSRENSLSLTREFVLCILNENQNQASSKGLGSLWRLETKFASPRADSPPTTFASSGSRLKKSTGSFHSSNQVNKVCF